MDQYGRPLWLNLIFRFTNLSWQYQKFHDRNRKKLSLCLHFLLLPLSFSISVCVCVWMLLITVNKGCYVSASVVQVSELMYDVSCLDPQLLSFTFSAISSFTISKRPVIYHTHKHTRAHIPTLFQEYCSITSWFWSHLLCLMGLLGETDRENEEMENYLSNQIVVFLWSDDEVALLFLCFLTTLLSNPWSRTVVHLG